MNLNELAELFPRVADESAEPSPATLDSWTKHLSAIKITTEVNNKK